VIQIRTATFLDHVTIVDFQLRMARETESIELDPPTVHLGVAAVFSDPKKGRYFVADCDGTLAGCLLTVPEWSDWRNGTVLWIHSVYVHPDFRRRGVYSAMYSHLRETVSRDDHLRGLRLYVHKDNAIAQKTYSMLGMDGEHYRMFEWMK
jgi:GNAT superfamily N-acetyltransferase